jgi:hypothetical protein
MMKWTNNSVKAQEYLEEYQGATGPKKALQQYHFNPLTNMHHK